MNFPEATLSIVRRPRAIVIAVLMVAVGAALMVGIGLVDRATSQTVLDRLSALGADTWTVSTPQGENGRAKVLVGAAQRASTVDGIIGAVLVDESSAMVTSGPVAAPLTESVELVGLEWAGDVRALELAQGTWGLDGRLPTAVAGPRAAEILGIVDLPGVVFADGRPLLVTGIVRGDAIHAPLARGVLVDDRWLASQHLSGARSLLAVGSVGAEPAALRSAANPLEPGGLSAALPLELAAAQSAADRSLHGGSVIVIASTYGASTLAVMLLFVFMVRGRTGEIGVRRCFGASTRRIASSILGEALTIGILGAAIGAAVGLVAGGTWATARGLNVAVDWPSVLVAAGISIASAVLAALAPAILAARMDPALAVGTAV